MKMSRMKHIIGILAWICLFTLVMSCSGKKEYDQLLERADSIMNITDDSAKVAIQMLDGAKSQLPHFSKRQEMRYQLLYHKAMNKAYIDFTSDSTMLEVANYYENHGTANDRMLAYYVLGCVYRDLHEAPMALEYYNKATEQADTTDTNCDYATLCRIYNQMGVLFGKQSLPNQELSSFQVASNFAYKAKDTLNAIKYYKSKSAAYVYLCQEDSAILVNNKAAELFRKHGYNRDADIAFGGNYEYFLRRNKLDSAKLAFEAFNRANFKGNAEYKDSYAFLLCERGEYFLKFNQLDSAYSTLTKSLALCQAYSTKSATTHILAEYFIKENNPLLAAKYALLSSAYNDSDLFEKRKTQLGQMQAMYDYSRNQKLAEKSELKVKERNFLILIFALSCMILFFIYVIRLYKKNQKIKFIEQLYHDCLQKLQKNEKELSQIKETNEKEIVKQKEMAIAKLKDTIKELRERFSDSLLTDTDIILQNSAIYRRFHYISHHPQESLTDDDWTDLQETIEQLIPYFSNILKNQLNFNEYRICLLIRIGIAPSTISHFIGLSNSGVSLSRKRMYEKIRKKEGTAKDFDKYILSIT